MTKRLLRPLAVAFTLAAGPGLAQITPSQTAPSQTTPIPAAPLQASPIDAAQARQPLFPNAPGLGLMRSKGASLWFLEHRAGFDTWVGNKDGQVQVLYVTNDVIIVGLMFDGAGRSITTEQLNTTYQLNPQILTANRPGMPPVQAQVPPIQAQPQAQAPVQAQAPTQAQAQPAPPVPKLIGDPDALMSWMATRTSWIPIGREEAPVIWMVADTQCAHCRRAWLDLAPLVEAGTVQVRMVLVAALNQSSYTEAAGILGSANPGAAWRQFKEQGTALPPQAQIPPVVNDAIARNTTFLRDSGIKGTPYIAFRDRDGKPVAIEGAPPDLKRALSGIL